MFFFTMATMLFCTIGDECNDQQQEKNWRLQAANVCFGAKDDSFGQFELRNEGKIIKFKLVHVDAENVKCNINLAEGTKWGCPSNPEILMVVITNATNDVIAPNVPITDSYLLPGFTSNSTHIILHTVPSFSSKQGQQMKIWYTQNLFDVTENNNGGSSCADVYAVFCE